MTKQTYDVRLAFLGTTSRHVASELGCSAAKLSDAVRGTDPFPSIVTLRAKADELTAALVNEKRRELLPEVSRQALAAGYTGEITLILPADCRTVVLADGKPVGLYSPDTREFSPF